MNQQFENYKITSFNTQQSESFFKLIDSNRARLEDFFAGTVSRTKTLKDTKQYCNIIAQKIKDKINERKKCKATPEDGAERQEVEEELERVHTHTEKCCKKGV